MNTTPQMAAQAWAHAHANRFSDPVEFGHKVAQVVSLPADEHAALRLLARKALS